MKFQKITLLLLVCSTSIQAAGLLPSLPTAVTSYFNATPQEPRYEHLTEEDLKYIKNIETPKPIDAEKPKTSDANAVIEFEFITPASILKCLNIFRLREKQPSNSTVFTASGSIKEIIAELTRLHDAKLAEQTPRMANTQKTELSKQAEVYKSLATNLEQPATCETLFAALEAINKAGTITNLSLYDDAQSE